jgi:hypothetical protein
VRRDLSIVCGSAAHLARRDELHRVEDVDRHVGRVAQVAACLAAGGDGRRLGHPRHELATEGVAVVVGVVRQHELRHLDLHELGRVAALHLERAAIQARQQRSQAARAARPTSAMRRAR